MTSLIGNLLEKVAPNSRMSQNLFIPSSKFQPARDIPDLSGKIVLVTGGNVGIGYWTVRALLEKNATVYLAARSASKAEEAIEKLQKETGKTATYIHLDLADLNSIKKTANEFLSKHENLDVLFNNAGVMIPRVPSPDELTSQGYDLQFGTNTLGPYYLTMLLLPALKRSTEMHGKKARVVNTSSAAHFFAPGIGIEWKALKNGQERDAQLKQWGYGSMLTLMSRWYGYGASKLGNIVFSHILNKYYGDSVASYSLHPGSINSDLLRHVPSIAQKMSSVILSHPEMGALTQLWAGTMPEAEKHVGAFLIPWARVGSPDPRSGSETLRDDLKAYMEKEIQAFESSPTA